MYIDVATLLQIDPPAKNRQNHEKIFLKNVFPTYRPYFFTI